MITPGPFRIQRDFYSVLVLPTTLLLIFLQGQEVGMRVSKVCLLSSSAAVGMHVCPTPVLWMKCGSCFKSFFFGVGGYFRIVLNDRDDFWHQFNMFKGALALAMNLSLSLSLSLSLLLYPCVIKVQSVSLSLSLSHIKAYNAHYPYSVGNSALTLSQTHTFKGRTLLMKITCQFFEESISFFIYDLFVC